jgi:hypothetical protein
MSRRTRARKAAAAASIPSPALGAAGPDVLRRTLLVVLVGLVVARPVVRAEDSGLLSELSDPGGMVLTLLGLLALTGWAGWRLWSGQHAVYAGLVELGLAIFALLLGVAASYASYRRAAWLGASEWGGVVVMIVLARQLAARPEEQDGLLAALLATAVALSAHAVYQGAVELPRAAAELEETPDAVRNALLQRSLEVSGSELAMLQERVERGEVHATFVRPASLAAFLVLLLPGLAGAVVACVRGGAPGWLTVLAAVFALLGVAALWLTRDRVAPLALGAGGLLLAGLVWKRPLLGALAAVGIAGVAGFALARLGALDEQLWRWRDLWPGSWRLVQAHPWSGVGPENFLFRYPREMTAESALKPAGPSSFLLEVPAAAGWPALLALLAALGAFFARVAVWRGAPAGSGPLLGKGAELPFRPSGGARPDAVTPATQLSGVATATGPGTAPPGAGSATAPASLPAVPVRWEFYVGGTFGLVLGFVLRVVAAPPNEVPDEAVAAGVRAFAWFGAFALYERVAWADAERVLALTAGALALVIALAGSDGVMFPSLMVPLGVVLALVLATVAPAPTPRLSRGGLAGGVVLTVLPAAAFAYFSFVFYPAAATDSATRASLAAGRYLLNDLARPAKERLEEQPRELMLRRVISPLLRAERDDAGNSRTRAQLAWWYGVLWSLGPDDRVVRTAVTWARGAQVANPEAPDGYVAEYEVHRRAARVIGEMARKAEKDARAPKGKLKDAQRAGLRRRAEQAQREQVLANLEAAFALERYVPRDPTDAPLRFQLAEALFEAGKGEPAREQAAEALRLDRKATRPWRKLSDAQREQVAKWFKDERGS